MGHDLGGIGHLRQQLGRDKGANFDFLHAGGDEGVDPGAFIDAWHGGSYGLQAVAWANLADQNIETGHEAKVTAVVTHKAKGGVKSLPALRLKR